MHVTFALPVPFLYFLTVTAAISELTYVAPAHPNSEPQNPNPPNPIRQRHKKHGSGRLRWDRTPHSAWTRPAGAAASRALPRFVHVGLDGLKAWKWILRREMKILDFWAARFGQKFDGSTKRFTSISTMTSTLAMDIFTLSACVILLGPGKLLISSRNGPCTPLG
jgi:hypothetical protein